MITDIMTSGIINLIELGWVNDRLTRAGIRRLCRKRLDQIRSNDRATRQQHFEQFIQTASAGPVSYTHLTLPTIYSV